MHATADKIEQRDRTARLIAGFSMTCCSAPFDQPNTDSIGEKFFQLPDRGAVAAGCRNSPGYISSSLLLEDLRRRATVGEAFLRAKQRTADRQFVHQYNLLGDPALPRALATARVGA